MIKTNDIRINILEEHSIIWWWSTTQKLMVLSSWTQNSKLFESPEICPKSLDHLYNWLGY